VNYNKNTFFLIISLKSDYLNSLQSYQDLVSDKCFNLEVEYRKYYRKLKCGQSCDSPCVYNVVFCWYWRKENRL